MPSPHRRSRRRPAVAAAIVGLVSMASLTACAPDASGAVALAERYADLVATGDADDLQSLWSASAAEPVAGRLAGRLLLEATERIEVLDVGDASAADASTSADAVHSDVVAWEAVEVPVRYALAGEEHVGVVVLAPIEDAPRGLESSWRIVAPLMGTLEVAPTGPYGIVPDVFVSDTRLQIDPAYAGAGVPMLPGVYDVQLRGEPYLTSDVQEIVVVAGAAASVSPEPLVATEEAEVALQESSDARFALCAERDVECPFDISDAARELDGPYPWDAQLVRAPSVTVVGAGVELDGGELLVQTAGGPVTLSFSGSGPWFIDNQSWRPVVSYTDLDLSVVQS